MDRAETSTRRSMRSKVMPNKQPRTVTKQKPKVRLLTGTKRKLKDPAEKAEIQLESLLTDSKSPLTTMNIFDILNYENFICLSEECQQRLCVLLPPTAFETYRPIVDPTHPSRAGKFLPRPKEEDSIDVDSNTPVPERSIKTLEPSLFISSFLQSAALTFQDHLYSSWFSRKARETEEKCAQGLRDGTMHTQWKDEVWEHDNDVLALSRNTHDADLATLAKRSLIQEGDVIVYEGKFNNDTTVIEKDLLVRSINPKSSAITLLLQPSVGKSLPPAMLVIGSPEPHPPILTMEGILSSVELEDEILETDGRISRSDRYAAIQENVASTQMPGGPDDPYNTVAHVMSTKAAKSLSVWRWREDMQGELELQMIQERGGRERLGTVYYLRNS